MKKWIQMTVLVLLAAGCAGTGMQVTENKKRSIAADYDSTFEAVQGYIQERGFSIMKADKVKGQIESQYREGAGWAEGFTGDKRAKVIARVTKVDEGTTDVVVNLISEVRDQYSGWQSVEMDVSKEQIYYSRFMEGIVARAEGRSIK
ncbi:MAG: hypothetical protein H6695_15020 [Deferribacteres bacterium]|nr:hypothetical protein [candidate division KSB1 bacterium]MCB9511498.1 hypothetical protein [Deferribacteres bacterium]